MAFRRSIDINTNLSRTHAVRLLTLYQQENDTRLDELQPRLDSTHYL
jgi:hypothetical protein